MADLDWQTVRSSNVAAIARDEQAGELIVRFASGGEYAYDDPDGTAYQDMLTTNSPGSYVSKWLRHKPARRLS